MKLSDPLERGKHIMQKKSYISFIILGFLLITSILPGIPGSDEPTSDEQEQNFLITINGHNLNLSRETKNQILTDQKETNNENKSGLYLIHLNGSVKKTWKPTLQQLGVTILNYVHNQAYRVWMTPDQAEQVKDLTFVNDVSIYPEALKIQKDLKPGKVIVCLVPQATTEKFQLIHNKTTVINQANTDEGIQFICEIDSQETLTEIARINEVLYLIPYIESQLLSEIESQIIGGGAWHLDDDNNINIPYREHGSYGAYINQLGYNGTGVTIALADTGLGNGTLGDAGHIDFTGRVIGGYYWDGSGWEDENGHGTHCAGLIAGNTYKGTNLTYGGFGPYYVSQGLASNSELYMVRIFDAGGSWIAPTDYFQILKVAKQNTNAVIHSNSWGKASGLCDGTYDERDHAYDRAVRDADNETTGNQPLIITVSAGNDGAYGYQSIGSPANAKNVISVGATETYMPDASSYGYKSTNVSDPDNISSFSSRGWTADNRIKPDVVAPGETILSTSSPINSDTTYYGIYNDTRYEWSSGTSMSNPVVAGAAAVIVQWYNETFNSIPSPAMVKAILINTAQDLNDTNGNTSPIPNRNEGWGMVNISKLVYPIEDPIHFYVSDQEHIFDNSSQTRKHYIIAEKQEYPLKISLVWTDKEAPSDTNNAKALRNDLNLTVESPSGKIYKGNAFVNGWTQHDTDVLSDFDTNDDGWDDTNNVENVYIHPDHVEQGTYIITITAYNLTENATNSNTENITQDYALLIYNARNQLLQNPPSQFSATSMNRTIITLNWTNEGNNNTYIEYNTTNGPWARGEGIILENSTNTTYNHTDLSFNTTYYYQAWSYNLTTQNYSKDFASAQAKTKENHPPAFINEHPTNQTISNNLSLQWNVTITDPEADRFTWSIECSDGNNTQTINDTNGTKTLSLSSLNYETEYTIWVNATDVYGAETKAWYTFTTKNEPWENTCPISHNESPANTSINVNTDISEWSIIINDSDGNKTNGSIHCSNGDQIEWFDQENSTQTLILSTLEYNTNYTIWLNFTDGHCNVNETFWFITESCYNLTITIQGNGTVTKNPDLSCYPNGSTVELNATADIGWKFSNWSGDISGEEHSTIVSMTTDYSITAIFIRKGPFTLTNTTIGNGSGIIEIHPTGPYYYGDTVTVWANASQGSSFTGFNGDLTGTISPQTLKMTENRTVNAEFTLNNYKLTINSTIGGSVTIPGEGNFNYSYGSSIPLEARPIIGYHFIEWNGENQTIANTKDNITTITIQDDSNITAIFSKEGPFTVNLTTNGTGFGTIEVNKTEPYYYGDTLTVWANASIGSTFTGFSGDLKGSNSPQTLTITENKTVNAKFSLDYYELNITIIGNGSVSCEPDQTCYTYETEVKLTPTADFPWYFSDWTGPNATNLVNNGDGSWNITILNDTDLTATFLEQWVNTCPVSSSESPMNKSNGIDINIGEWSVIITDADGNNTNGSIHCSNGDKINWNDEENGTRILELSILDYNTNYTIYLNYTDGHCVVNETFWFITRNQFIPNAPINFNAETKNRFSINLTWISTDDSTYIEYNTTSSWIRGEGEFLFNDSTNSCQHKELDSETTYYYQAWSYNTTDNTWSTVATDQNTTLINQPPSFTNPSPANESNDQDLSFTWMIDINDSEGDTFNWSIECNNSHNNNGIDETNNTKQLSLISLAYSTTYMIWVNATDAYGAETKEWYTFTTKNAPWENSCPTSNSVSPVNESTNVPITVDQWSVTITDADGNTTNGNITCSNGESMNWSNQDNGTKTLNVSSLNYNTKYTINLNYTDGHCTVNETYWFTTAQKPTNTNPGGGGTGGGGSGGIPPPTNQNPIANATVDKNTGHPGEIFMFNASASRDMDGEIVNYTWNFDDGVNSSTNQTTITHTFTSSGLYHVMLTVIDENGGLDTLEYPLIIDIIQANNPPRDLVVIPEDNWTHQNTEMIFMMSATDPDDNDTIRFEVYWGDGNKTVSQPVNSSDIYEIDYAWKNFGSYTITVTAYDKTNATTDTFTMTMLVDISILDEINGWIIDQDGDGIFDQYKDLTNATVHTNIEQENGNYLIDINNDGNWDYEYQVATDQISPHNQVKEKDGNESFPLWGIAMIIILGILAFIGILFFTGIIYIEYEE